jgi:SDR family mycofactocin-dependent oxidoreductase
MTERVAIVTGAGRGIGAATARALAAGGWSLVLVDRCADDPALAYPLATRDELDGVVAACDAAGGHAVAVVADVRDQGALDDAVAIAVDRFGGLDAAVAAAGAITGGDTTWTTDEAAWSVMFDVNVDGVWRLAKAAVPALLARPAPRQGRFVAISSMGGSVGLPRLTAYVAAKHAVNGIVRSMAAELGRDGVTVNAIAPGSTMTEMLRASAELYGVELSKMASLHLLGRPLEPTEIAALAAWVCGEASSGITGAVLPVDAGATAQ